MRLLCQSLLHWGFPLSPTENRFYHYFFMVSGKHIFCQKHLLDLKFKHTFYLVKRLERSRSPCQGCRARCLSWAEAQGARPGQQEQQWGHPGCSRDPAAVCACWGQGSPPGTAVLQPGHSPGQQHRPSSGPALLCCLSLCFQEPNSFCSSPWCRMEQPHAPDGS